MSFGLNRRRVRRQYATAILACAAVLAACIVLALLLGDRLAGPGHSSFLIMALGTGMFVSAIALIVLATRLFDLRSTPARVTVDSRGIWMGETYYSFTDLRSVAVTPADRGRPRRRRLVLTPLDEQRVVYRLGAAATDETMEADYRQFVQVLTTAVAAHPNLPPITFLD
ncbi:hypothetical protein [Tersicoccus phoenicis]|uniref:hypothetical protein n=1 Tax=Tersicoccus phoenicis TaxID=554083 RepID=UPI0009770394|nr:hypothetical protein [Tersicoccus phoenicis]